MPLILGREVEMDINATTGNLTFLQPQARSANRKLRSLIKPLIFIVGFFGVLYLLYSLLLRNI